MRSLALQPIRHLSDEPQACKGYDDIPAGYELRGTALQT